MRTWLFLLSLLLLAGSAARACAVCRPKVQAGIYNAAYSANLLLVLLPVALLLALGLALFFAKSIRFPFFQRRA
ncbi:hypothetical protein ACFST9_04970 [Hymenobacter monticola]|uniref:Uncharacterized protein n=1 Tax=Hymenobacter monticola TaxID=1705399 RepID=A0ABY4B9Y5_9BACT|nr:hypothetical protein [Hymenobacter monticola]UOE35973.1 hypothetical protein MTP16_10100 [Hymenobacter monticola]